MTQCKKNTSKLYHILYIQAKYRHFKLRPKLFQYGNLAMEFDRENLMARVRLSNLLFISRDIRRKLENTQHIEPVCSKRQIFLYEDINIFVRYCCSLITLMRLRFIGQPDGPLDTFSTRQRCSNSSLEREIWGNFECKIYRGYFQLVKVLFNAGFPLDL